MGAPSGKTPLRLYLAIVFWGEQYRRYFLDFCLASLMAAGNIPAIADKAQARLLIATTAEDWSAMQSEPIFQAVAALIPVEHVSHEVASAVANSEKMSVMSRGHKALAQRMFEDRAHGVFIMPDMIASANFLGKLQELALKGIKAVLYMNVRFANDGVLDDLKSSGAVHRGKPLVVAADELVRLTIKNMHSEAARGRFDSDSFDFGSHSFFWPLPSGEDLVFHCGSWLPVLIDYGSVGEHDVSTFDFWTLDGDYIAKNFPDIDRVYASRHSDELFMISFTPESGVHYALAPYWLYRIGWVRNLIKTCFAHYLLYQQGILDPIKKELIHLPVRLRGGHPAEADWRAVEARAARVMRRIEETDLSWSDRLLLPVLGETLRAILRVLPLIAKMRGRIATAVGAERSH